MLNIINSNSLIKLQSSNILPNAIKSFNSLNTDSKINAIAETVIAVALLPLRLIQDFIYNIQLTTSPKKIGIESTLIKKFKSSADLIRNMKKTTVIKTVVISAGLIALPIFFYYPHKPIISTNKQICYIHCLLSKKNYDLLIEEKVKIAFISCFTVFFRRVFKYLISSENPPQFKDPIVRFLSFDNRTKWLLSLDSPTKKSLTEIFSRYEYSEEAFLEDIDDACRLLHKAQIKKGLDIATLKEFINCNGDYEERENFLNVIAACVMVIHKSKELTAKYIDSYSENDTNLDLEIPWEYELSDCEKTELNKLTTKHGKLEMLALIDLVYSELYKDRNSQKIAAMENNELMDTIKSKLQEINNTKKSLIKESLDPLLITKFIFAKVDTINEDAAIKKVQANSAQTQI